MSKAAPLANQVKQRRVARGWSQEELAREAGISRTEISAIETQRVVPSVAAALAIGAALGARVEELFGHRSGDAAGPAWAWPAAGDPARFWHAEVGGRVLWYPVEGTDLGEIGHDGLFRNGVAEISDRNAPQRTLVMACCDPAAALLATELARVGDFRLLVLPRSSGRALELLGAGLVHVAGVHLSHASRKPGNAGAVREALGPGFSLVHVARWTEGLAVGPGVSLRNVQGAVRSKLRWIGREPGSGARQCLDEILEGRAPPRRIARDHRGVADAIRCGWGDVGVCLQLVSEEAGLGFLSVRDESYDLCFRTELESDPRLRALISILRSSAYRKLLGELPGYDATHTGELTRIE
jgi:molybdate-binding protein/DNA-binding XRE family transcriptional regulator